MVAVLLLELQPLLSLDNIARDAYTAFVGKTNSSETGMSLLGTVACRPHTHLVADLASGDLQGYEKPRHRPPASRVVPMTEEATVVEVEG